MANGSGSACVCDQGKQRIVFCSSDVNIALLKGFNLAPRDIGGSVSAFVTFSSP